MEDVLRRAHTLDAVTLLRPADGWPVGTVGTVVEDDPGSGHALVEVVNHDRLRGMQPADGFLEDLVEVPYAYLRVIDGIPALNDA